MPWWNIHKVDSQWGSCHGGWSSSQLFGGTRPETEHISHLPSSLPTWEYIVLRFGTVRFWWKKHIRYSRIKCSIKRGVSGTPCCIWLRQLSIVLCSDLSVVRGLLLGHKYPNYIIAHPIAWLMFVRPFAEFDFTDLYSIFMTCSQLMMQCSEVRPIQ